MRVRDGHTGPRPAGAIGFATLRGGSVIGDHSVMLAGEGEVATVLLGNRPERPGHGEPLSLDALTLAPWEALILAVGN